MTNADRIAAAEAVQAGRRVMGTETEYGILTPDDAYLSPIMSSTHLVVAYNQARRERAVAWDYAHESPLADARGFDLRRYHHVPQVDPNAVGVANVMCTNGARFYVDHAHPEYSSPEITDAMQALVYDLAGDVIARRAVADVAELSAKELSVLQGQPPAPAIKLYKNNVDGKGASYGSHENYLVDRAVDFDFLAQALIPFMAARIVLIGAGRVGLGQHSQQPGFQISQRADYIEQQISLETTLNRGLINTRDEPHADHDHYRRLHVITGDANMSQTSFLLKPGLMDLVLHAIEQGESFAHLGLADPVAAMHTISHDPTCKATVPLAAGGTMTGIQLVRGYLDRLSARPGHPTDALVLHRAGTILDLLESDPRKAAPYLDWCAKYNLMLRYADRGISWDSPHMQLIDVQYSDIDPEKGLYHALVRKGTMATIVEEEEVQRAAEHAPGDTRGYWRGFLLNNYPFEVRAMSWESVALAIGENEHGVAEIAQVTAPNPLTPNARLIEELWQPDHPLRSNLAALEAAGAVSVTYLAE